MDETRLEKGALQNSSPGYAVGAEWLQEKTRAVKEKLMDIVNHDLKDMDTTWE